MPVNPANRPRSTGVSIHDNPDSSATLHWNVRSRSPGIPLPEYPLGNLLFFDLPGHVTDNAKRRNLATTIENKTATTKGDIQVLAHLQAQLKNELTTIN